MNNNNLVTEKIRVIVRKRPINKKEIQKNDIDIIEARNLKTLVAKELKYYYQLSQKQSRHDKVHRRAPFYFRLGF